MVNSAEQYSVLAVRRDSVGSENVSLVLGASSIGNTITALGTPTIDENWTIFAGKSTSSLDYSNINIRNFTSGETYYVAALSLTSQGGTSVFDAPEGGHEFVRIGNIFEPDRQGSVYMTSDDDDAPYIDIIDEVNWGTKFNTSGVFKSRFGKLEGITDPVYGQLEGYGSYTQNLYASGNAQIAGTLTAGDVNGVGNTFYAGRIRKNLVQDSNNMSNWPTIGSNTQVTPNQGISPSGENNANLYENINNTTTST